VATRHQGLRGEMEELPSEMAMRNEKPRSEMGELRSEMAMRHEQLLGAIRTLASGGSAPPA
jgi:hypothetical protein